MLVTKSFSMIFEELRSLHRARSGGRFSRALDYIASSVRWHSQMLRIGTDWKITLKCTGLWFERRIGGVVVGTC